MSKHLVGGFCLLGGWFIDVHKSAVSHLWCHGEVLGVLFIHTAAR
jgi:hypothetical protein